MKKRQGRRRYLDTVDPHQRGRNDNAEATGIRYDRAADAYELQLRAGTRLTVPRRLLGYLPPMRRRKRFRTCRSSPWGTPSGGTRSTRAITSTR